MAEKVNELIRLHFCPPHEDGRTRLTKAYKLWMSPEIQGQLMELVHQERARRVAKVVRARIRGYNSDSDESSWSDGGSDIDDSLSDVETETIREEPCLEKGYLFLHFITCLLATAVIIKFILVYDNHTYTS